MASLNDYPAPRVDSGREFHLVDLIPCDWRSTERPAIEARLCEIEGALRTWLQIRIAALESVRSVNGNNEGMASLLRGFDEEVAMAKDDRDILELLRTELDFLEKGGYGRSVKTPWKPTSAFRDSLTCVNYALPEKAHPCSECHLIDFVPPDCRADELPCHHIPLNEAGDTVKNLELENNQAKLEAALREWMRTKIREIETARLAASEDVKTQERPS